MLTDHYIGTEPHQKPKFTIDSMLEAVNDMMYFCTHMKVSKPKKHHIREHLPIFQYWHCSSHWRKHVSRVFKQTFFFSLSLQALEKRTYERSCFTAMFPTPLVKTFSDLTEEGGQVTLQLQSMSLAQCLQGISAVAYLLGFFEAPLTSQNRFLNVVN